jgi:hypothetical protein
MRLHRETDRLINKLSIGLFAGAALAGVLFVSGSAVALPTNGLAAPTSHLSTEVENVLWVCRPHRCWWIPPLAYYPPPPFVVYRFRPLWWHRR